MDENLIGELFNDYFNIVAQNLNSNLPQNEIDPLAFVHKNENSIFLAPVGETEISTILSEIKIKKGNINSCTDQILKKIHSIVAPVLCKIVSLSFQNGAFYDCLQIA